MLCHVRAEQDLSSMDIRRGPRLIGKQNPPVQCIETDWCNSSWKLFGHAYSQWLCCAVVAQPSSCPHRFLKMFLQAQPSSFTCTGWQIKNWPSTSGWINLHLHCGLLLVSKWLVLISDADTSCLDWSCWLEQLLILSRQPHRLPCISSFRTDLITLLRKQE